MFNRQEQKRCSSFARYFLFYAISIAYLLLTSCFGVQEKLIPRRNKMLANLTEQTKDIYAELYHSLDDHQKEKLQKEVDKIEDPSALVAFIDQTAKVYKSYEALIKLYPKPERDDLKEKFGKIIDLKYKKALIDQYASTFETINNSDIYTRQYYSDFLEILPDDEAIRLKNKIIRLTNPGQVAHLIASLLPNSFKELDKDAKEAISKLPDDKRQEILKAAISQSGKQGGLNIDPRPFTDDNYPIPPLNDQYTSASKEEKHTPLKDESSTTIASDLDIHKLIKQKVKEQEEQAEPMPQDGWGTKLPLVGQERKEFLTDVMEFPLPDQKELKEFFHEANEDSIVNFFEVYFNDTIFKKNERIDLLSTMIYLYKAFHNLAITLCNDPEQVKWYDKLTLFRAVHSSQLRLLQELEKGLEEL